MRCAEDYVRFCCKYLLEHCGPDLAFINKMIDSTAIQRLQQVGARALCGGGEAHGSSAPCASRQQAMPVEFAACI
jgi:hypothetical protein